MKSSMPAAWHRSWSLFMAWAVKAMMGTWPPVSAFALANRRRGFVTVHVRHLDVHQDEVEGLAKG